MTSEERREARYRRRVAKRRQQKEKLYADCMDFGKVFSYGNLYQSYRRCRLGVAWKGSVQKYIVQAPVLVKRTQEQLMAGKFKSSGFYEFDLFERGKKRHIMSVTVRERVVQKCLCDNALVPIVGRSFIYDNGASMKDKGYHFAIRRMVRHLQKHYRKHGREGYILLFDFSKFFDNVSHKVTEKIINREFPDKRLAKLINYFVGTFGEKGMGLGSQISQTLALASANRLDHAVKEEMHIKGYGRYMDDGYLIHESKEYLKECLEKIKALCVELGITLNLKKTQIVKISHGFTWLKCRFSISETGKVVRKIYKRSVTKMRQKVKALKRMMDAGRISMEDVRTSTQSWMSYAMGFDSCGTLKNTVKLLNEVHGTKDARKLLKVKKVKHNRNRKKMRYVQYLMAA